MSGDIPLADGTADVLPSLKESIAYLESREDFQQAKTDYLVHQEATKPRTRAQRTEQLNDLPLHKLVKLLDEQPPFDIAVGITDFLRELGAFNEQLLDDPERDHVEDQQTDYSQDILIDEADLNLLTSVLSPALAHKLGRSPQTRVHEDQATLKALLLNTLARLALTPPLTVPIARSFRPIFVDLASRWLLLLGFNGTGFQVGHASTNTLIHVLAALGRSLPEFPQLYPILLLTLQHPHLQAESISHLLSSSATIHVPDGPSSAINASASVDNLIYHPELLQLLLTVYTLLVSVPQLPLLRTIRQYMGGPAPPSPVEDVLSCHPNLAMRTLAWHIASLWFGWTGPKKEELRRKYVYDPTLDEENGSEGRMITDVPLRDPEQPFRYGEWLPYWSRLPEQPAACLSPSMGLQVRLEVPQIDAWVFEERVADCFTHEWTVERTPISQENRIPGNASDMAIDGPSTESTLLIAKEDQCPLLAQIAGISLLKEVFIADTLEQTAAEPGRALEHAQTASILKKEDVFVPTSTSIAALRQLAVHVSARTPVLLSSPPAAGKASTLHELHRLLHEVPFRNGIFNRKQQDIVTINLADKSLDAKNLLGTLTSSPTQPGTFVFAEGSLTRAIRHGRWVILEDIDKASDEVLSTISELVERIRSRAQEAIGGGWGGVSINGVGVQAGGEWVNASENFMLFATRSVPSSSVELQSSEHDGTLPIATFFGSQYWSHVWMDAPDLDEIQCVIEGRFPRLARRITEALVQTWARIVESTNTIYSTSSTGLTRTIGMRDLVKWCRRVQASLPGDIDIITFSQNPRLQDEVFLDARDIFLNSFATRNTVYDGILQALRTGLELSQERIDWALESRIPEVSATGNKPGSIVHYGRVSLAKGKHRHRSGANRPYALTKPFLLVLEGLAAAVKLQEPVLLVGETGTGKTTAITQLAEMLGHNLISLNLSNQTEASDLLGGFRPVNEAEVVARKGLELVNLFTDLFATSFEASRNLDYGVAVQKAFKKKRWSRLAGLFREAASLAETKLSRMQAADSSNSSGPRKKRKIHNQDLLASWTAFKQRVVAFEVMANEAASKSSKFKFTFIEGPLIRALRNGDWVLLDEVNLATSETLESLSSLLQSASSSLVLTERGDLEPVQRHPDFRIFACMNPANDVGKRDLPPALRVKFTEAFVLPPDADKDVLLSVIHGYIGHAAVGDRGVVQDIAELYLKLKGLAQAGRIADGSNHPPHFSMRTLARSLVFTADFASEFGIRRAAYEGIAMCFTTLLDGPSKELVQSIMHDYLVERSKSPRSFFKTVVQPPRNAQDFVSVGSFWLAKGGQSPQAVDDYVLTPSVEDKLIGLARAIAAARFPILLQGPTSSGKTSIIEYLAKRSGHNFVRINNHEHTDIQEYLGTYMSDPDTGKLVFQEGLLVTAVREGHWVVLDELNLAPTDVLEALNRLLDDNRELVIPGTQEVVKPHPHFMLFATQNPPGLYGGRKVLSRAFRNRFLEMQFSDVPQDELETILCRKCQIAPSYAKKIVAVFLELQRRRQNTRLFEEKQAFVTLRDLFRWGSRGAVGYEQLALDGYMLLAERTRKEEDKGTVREVIEQIMKVPIASHIGYEAIFNGLHVASDDRKEALVWTTAMKRLYVLVHTALSFNEPVLLVGETGSGKTSVCQAVANGLGRKLHIVNCHQNTETSDLIGSQRPVRNKKATQEVLRSEGLDHLKDLDTNLPSETTFEVVYTVLQGLHNSNSETANLLQRMDESQALFTWYDGPLVEAMRRGDMLLLDEISLADDSVLERLNSVLEPARTLTIAEKGSKHSEGTRVQAQANFQIIGTMNPGGDFGKKELSPALRNRFTEIWVPWLSEEDDILGILHARLDRQYSQTIASGMLQFAKWFTEQILPREPYSFGSVITLRDLLAWTDFMVSYGENEKEAFVHGALMSMVDSLGSTIHTFGLKTSAISALRDRSIEFLESLVSDGESGTVSSTDGSTVSWTGNHVFEHFLSRLTKASSRVNVDRHFSFSAPTVRLNTLRVMRALQVSKPILLEGSPGVGKTSLVTALATATSHALCRINLSDQTDLVDLFGSESPVEGGKAGEFAWIDAPFLAAMQEGHWVLLDEMNLASQSVLEGLNSCLDHRGTVYIPELDKVFSKHPDFRIFAAQNPSNQGGSRKGLPRSFVDRFTQVYMDDLDELDYYEICCQLYPSIEPNLIRKMVSFVVRIADEVAHKTGNFAQGSPWELNLRDLLRWLSMIATTTGYERRPGHPVQYLDVLFIQRFRHTSDREFVSRLCQEIFGTYDTFDREGRPTSTSTSLRIGANLFLRTDPALSEMQDLRHYGGQVSLRAMEALATSVANNQLVILTGASKSGKTALVRNFAALTGRSIRTFYVNAQTDTLEMLGSFEQCSHARHRALLLRRMQSVIDSAAVQSGSPLDIRWKSVNRTSRALACVRNKAFCDPPAFQTALKDFESCLRGSILEDSLRGFLSTLNELELDAEEAGRFEFVDGILIQAMMAGDILVIENANRCNPAVLDRLNGLFETGGKLILSERGLDPNGSLLEVKPHANFRVIMTLDPREGELSRAMRNRGIEIALLAEHAAEVLGQRPRQQVTALIPSRLDRDRFEKVEESGTIAECDRDRADLLHALGSAPFTDLPRLRFRHVKPSISPAILHKILENPIWATILTRRPGQVPSDISGQSHAITFFSLDTNEALRDRPIDEIHHQLALDEMLEGLVDLTICQLQYAAAGAAVLTKSVATLTISEQAFLHSMHPARLPAVVKGVDTIRQLQEALLQTVGKAINPAALDDIHITVAFIKDMTNCLGQLLALFAARDFNYTIYQALLTEISKRLCFAQTSPSLEPLCDKLRMAISMAEDSVKRSTGHYMESIWAYFQNAMPSMPEELSDVEAWQTAWLPADLTELYMDVIESGYRNNHVVDASFLAGLRNKISAFDNTPRDRALPPHSDTLVSLNEISIATQLLRGSPARNSLGRVVSRIGQRSLLSLTPILRQLADPACSPIAMLCEWLRSVMSQSKLNREIPVVEGLLTDTHLRGALDMALSSRHAPLSNLSTVADTIAMAGQAHFELAAAPKVSRKDSLTILALGMLVETVRASGMALSLDNVQYTDINRLITDVLACLSTQSAHGTRPLCDALQALTGHQNGSASSSLQALSRLYVCMAVWVWSLYVPDISLDPSLRSHAVHYLYKRETNSLLAEAAVEDDALKIPGGRGARRLEVISCRLQELDEQLKNMDPIMRDEEACPELLAALFAELRTCTNALIESEILDSITRHDELVPPPQLENLQASLVAIHTRLTTLYESYADLVMPITLALGCATVGLGIRIHECRISVHKRTSATVTEATKRLVAWPTSATFQSLIDMALPTSPSADIAMHVPPATAPLLTLQAIAAINAKDCGRLDAQNLQQVWAAYHQLYALWTIDHKRAEQERIQAESIYRSRREDVDVASEAAKEEAELMSLFPTFDEEDRSTAQSQSMPNGREGPRTLLRYDDVRTVYNVHTQLFSQCASTDAKQVSTRQALSAAKREVLELFHASFPALIGESVDLHASPVALRILAETAASFSDKVVEKTADFYHDANVHEAGKLRDLLQNGLERIHDLISAWPEQMVLVELADRCNALLAITSTAPIAKLLTFVESLLLKITDWETYASRENSLSSFSGCLTALVVDWRRLELKSWAGLLEAQERSFREPIAEWWFRMYDLCIQGPDALFRSDTTTTLKAEEDYVDTLLRMVQTFVEQTPAGQFRDKLSLLKSFGNLTANLSADLAVFTRISTALFNLSSFYEMQALRIDTFLREEKKKIEKELHEVIRLASWKDVNVYALKASAQKSHRQLYKRVRALVKVLETPASRFQEDSKDTNTEETILKVANRLFTAVPEYRDSPFTPIDKSFVSVLPRPLVNIEATVSRLSKIVRDDSDKHESEPSDAHLGVLVESIIARSQELRNEQPTGKTNEDRRKNSNALMDRKRKAWSSLLAEAKHIGLSARPSTSQVQHLSRMVTVFETAPLATVASDLAQLSPVLQSTDKYFYRILSLMPLVRSAASQHHPDVIPSQLQNAAGCLDSAFKTAHTSRTDIYQELRNFDIVLQAHRKLLVLKDKGLTPVQPASVGNVISAFLSNLSTLQSALEETLQYSGDQAQYMAESDKSLLNGLQTALRGCIDGTKGSLSELKSVSVEHGDIAPMVDPHVQVLRRARETWRHVEAKLTSNMHNAPRLEYLLHPTLIWMDQEAKILDWPTSEPETTVQDACMTACQTYATTMSAILVSIQNLQEQPDLGFQEDGDYASGGLNLHYRDLKGRMQTLHTANISQRVQKLISAIAELSKHKNGIALASQLIERSVPILTNYLQLANSYLASFVAWHRSLLKFMYVFAQTTLTLGREGFCRPSEPDEGGGEASNLEGTGMGAGEGTNNVSDQIENQEQVEGLDDQKEEESPADQNDSTGKDDMLDMDDDFGGKTQDVDEKESDDASEDEEEEREQDDLDEELGKVDPLDPTAVDDKFWDDKQDEGEDKSPPPEEQSKQQAGDNDAEVGERQEPKQQADRDEVADEDKDPNGQENASDAGSMDLEEDNVSKEMEEDGAEGEEGKRQELPDVDTNEDTLDLPDDMNIDPHNDHEEDDDEIDEELTADQIDPETADSDEQAEDAEENMAERSQDQEDGTTDMPPEETEPSNDSDMAFTHESAGPDEGSGENTNTAGGGGTTDGDNASGDTREPQPAAKDAAEPGDAAEQTQDADRETVNDGPSSSTAAAEGQGEGENMQTAQRQSENKTQEIDTSGPDDKQLGDAAQAFMRRLEAISQPSEKTSQDANAPNPESADTTAEAEIEYVREGEDDHDLQAMGIADEDSAEKKRAEAADPDVADDFQALDLDQSRPAEDQVLLHHIPQSNLDPHHQSGQEDDLEDSHGKKTEPSEEHDQAHGMPLDKPLPVVQSLVPDHAEIQLQHWLADGRESLPSEEVWRLYTNLTRDLSFSLTESLRLVLEPTLATRLKGDYRTGKRLNMRKIIPYIASDYTKDKIWLRRTRPSQREYQVLLALDDSRSMADSRAVHLAYQTLALVCQSLTKLEVGEVSICKFGEQTQFLHNFEDGNVSEAVGARIVDSFQFAQKSTDIKHLLENSLERFQTARDRRGGSAADLWQLEIIVSDGMCQDLEDIRSLLRKARQQKVMVMFVVLDSLHGNSGSSKDPRRDSILSMKSVSYQKSKSGALELKMERYMDTFPFEYYVILRDVEALPEVLGETLRQFFDKVRGDAS